MKLRAIVAAFIVIGFLGCATARPKPTVAEEPQKTEKTVGEKLKAAGKWVADGLPEIIGAAVDAVVQSQ